MANPVLNIAIIGVTESGKSTIAGHLLNNLGKVDDATIQQNDADSTNMNKQGYLYAWVSDTTEDERQRGKTMHAAIGNFDTDQYSVTLIDTPGNRDCFETTAAAISQADFVFLVVSAGIEGFDLKPTFDLALTASACGIRNVMVGVNKMEVTNPPYDKNRYNELVNEVSRKLRGMGYGLERISMVPISGLANDNLTEASGNLSWYTGPTLLQALGNPPCGPDRDSDKPLRLAILTVSAEDGGTFINGQIQAGSLQNGAEVTIMPGNVTATVNSLEVNNQSVDSASPGSFVRINLGDADSSTIQMGCVLGPSDNPPKTVVEFTAQVIIVQDRGVTDDNGDDVPTGNGCVATMFCHTLNGECKFEEIISTVDRRTGEVLQDHPEALQRNDTCIIRITPTNEICVEKKDDYRKLAGFVLRDPDSEALFACGVITDVVYADS